MVDQCQNRISEQNFNAHDTEVQNNNESDEQTPTNYFNSNSNVIDVPLNTPIQIDQDLAESVVPLSLSPIGSCGLRNLGNTCFMNAGLQCLFNNTHLIKFFLEDYEPNCSTLNTLCGKFTFLFRKIWIGNNVISPREFKEMLGISFAQFLDYRQHDCQEFLAILLDALHQQLSEEKLNNKPILTSQFVYKTCKKPITEDNSIDFNSPAFKKRRDTSPDNNSVNSSSNNSPFVPIMFSDSPDFSPKPNDNDLSEKYVKNETIECFTNRSIDFEDLCMKDTKTLNTNVAAADLEIEEPKADSEKFVNNSHDNLDIDTIETNHAIKACFLSKAENLTGNVTEKLSYMSKQPLLVDNLTKEKKMNNFYTNCSTSSTFMNMTRITNKEDETNNIKMFKSNGSDKNVRMQAKLKVNTDRNIIKVNELKEVSSVTLNNLPDSKDNITNESKCLGNINSERRSSISLKSDEEIYVPTQQEIIQADDEWNKYMSINRSVLVETFQGQFQSRVKCGDCSHISVTFEPFMYLSVPLPHAMEKQIEITFLKYMSFDAPKKILLTMNFQDDVKKLKESIMSLLLLPQYTEIVICEVYHCKICRILENYMVIRNINDSYRSIYAIEVKSDNEFNEDIINSSPIANDAISPLVSPIIITEEKYGLENNHFTFPSQPNKFFEQDSFPIIGNFVLDQDYNKKTCSTSCDTFDYKSTQYKDNSSVETGTDIWKYDNTHTNNNWNSNLSIKMNFKPCTICLDDKESSLLLIHTKCDAIVCKVCFDTLKKLYTFCPVCQMPLNEAIYEFIPLSELGDIKTDIRVMRIAIAVRSDLCDGPNDVGNLCCHPNIIFLPNITTGKHIYEFIKASYSFCEYIEFKVVLTNRDHLLCSRCLDNTCKGCPIYETNEHLSLMSNDSLTICVKAAESVMNSITDLNTNHISLKEKRNNENLTIEMCIKAFSNTELLDENNPWFCPNCGVNRCADKRISIWRLPDTLIIHLKRFIFHNYASVKLENKVVFPLTDLDLTNYTCSSNDDQLLYDLIGCVCHSGNVNTGHYTSFTKHPVNCDWFEYNDDIVSLKKPQHDDYYNAYVLFYQRQGTEKQFNIPESKLNPALTIDADFLTLSKDIQKPTLVDKKVDKGHEDYEFYQ